VFADNCGTSTRSDPAQSLAGAYMSNTSMGAILGAHERRKEGVAPFSSRPRRERSAAPVRSPGRSARDRLDHPHGAFFGTGGIETYSTTKQNAFYAIYADNGSIRSQAARHLQLLG